MKVLVTGSTGKVGSEVVKQLGSRGAEVRVLVRKESAAKAASGTEVAIGDLLDPVSVEHALKGVDKLFLLNGVVSDETTQALIVYDLARRIGLKHIVYLSVFHVENFKDVPHFASKLTVESAIRQFDLPFTILRPNYYFQNDASLKGALESGFYPIPLGATGISAVDIRDIAEAAAIALTDQGHEGHTYDLVGPHVLSGQHAASIWSKLLNKEIHYAGEDLDGYEKQMRELMPGWMAFDFRMMFQGYLERGFVAQSGDIDRLTKLLGHAPRAYEDFVRETVEGWKKSGAILNKR